MMNERQQEAIQLAKSGHNVFVTGGIGTGKTRTLENVIRTLESEGKVVAVTAATGLASKQIQGCDASTLHHWAGMKDSRYSDANLLELLNNDISFQNARQRIIDVDVLVIDEISMISKMVFCQLEFICRSIRGTGELFGGIQLVVSGDFRQLKPVPNCLKYDVGDYCFNAPAWKAVSAHTVVLTEVMRQRELVLIMAVQELSVGHLSGETVAFLRSLSRPLPADTEPVYLYARNFDVAMTNFDKLYDLPGQEKSYKSEDTGHKKHHVGFQAPKVLVLKLNAKVMLLVNLGGRLVNGTLGEVCELLDDSCVVNFEHVGRVMLERYTFSVYSREENVNIATRKQLPLKLAYALTIHKAQGMNLPHVVVDAHHADKPGQLATAVGRAQLIDGLQLINFNHNSVPEQPSSVNEFLRKCQEEASDLSADLSCCTKQLYVDDAIEEFPLGELPVEIQPELWDDLQHVPRDDEENDSMCDDDGFDDPDMESILDDVQSAQSISMDDSGPHETSSEIQGLNVETFRSEVQQDFILAETKQQQLTKDKDCEITTERFIQSITRIWKCLEKRFQHLDAKGSGNLEHRDFLGFFVEFDRYRDSTQYNDDIGILFDHELGNEEKKLAFKYTQKLAHKFLAYKAEKSSEDPVPSTSSESPLADVSSASKSAIRYLSGMCFAKACYKQSQLALNNVHKLHERQRVLDARLRVSLLQRHILSQDEIQKTSSEIETLAMIQRKQNTRHGLTHVSDNVFAFFQQLDRELSFWLSSSKLTTLKGELFVHAERDVLHKQTIMSSWQALFDASVHEQFLSELMELTVKPYIHVRCNQFRKDVVSKLREDKTLEIRKAVWNRKRQSNVPPPKHRPLKRRNNLVMQDILSDTSDRFQSSHTKLAELCVSNTKALAQLTKENLKRLCVAYELHTNARSTKEMMIEMLRIKIPSCQAVPVPEALSGSSVDLGRSSSSQSAACGEPTSECPMEQDNDYICPSCQREFTDDAMWVGCDNAACAKFICRNCANLQDDDDYHDAVSSDGWYCPMCT